MMRGRFSSVWPLQLALLLTSIAGCDQLDPIKTTNLCEASGDISENCPQCLTSPIAPECPQCRVNGAPPECFEATGMNQTGAMGEPQGGDGAPGTGGDAANGGGPSAGAAAANGGNGSRGGNSASPGGGGKPGGGTAGANGTQPGSGVAGTGGRAPMSTDCHVVGCPMENMHACLPSGLCGQCTDASFCPGRACDQVNALCVDCTDSTFCSDGKICDLGTKTCIDCKQSSDCKKDGRRACDTQTNTCVECVDTQTPNGCQDPTLPACLMQKCVECLEDTNCPGTKPRCVTEDNHCVECKQDPDCLRVDSKRPVCLEEENRCVECNADRDCKSPSASHCNTSSHTCEPCSKVEQCSHISGQTVCDTADHKCVECVDMVNSCNGKACILSTHKCSTVEYGSRRACEECASRTECLSGWECVQITGMAGTADGTRCYLPTANAKTCGRPYARAVNNVVSADGTTVSVCAEPAQTSCKAMLDSQSDKPCPDGRNASCGWGMSNDGICDSDSNTCTTNCKTDTECPPGKACVNLVCK